MALPLMKCGCVAQAAGFPSGAPICVTHVCTDVADVTPSLDGRQAICASCKQTMPSSYDLAFFEYRPAREHDGHYCGCRGWD